MADQLIRILLIEDDEDDYVILRDLVSKFQMLSCQVDWVSTPDAALKKISSCEYQVCILDYRLGENNGIELLDILRQKGFDATTMRELAEESHLSLGNIYDYVGSNFYND